jgi:fatty acid desaturase
MRNFRGLHKNTRFLAISIVAFYAAQVVLAIILGSWLLQHDLTWASGLGLGALVFFIATRLRGFNNIVHECSHYTFSVNREDNRILGSICASLNLGCFRDYRDEHLTHHAHVGDYEKDMDLHGIEDLRLEAELTPKTVLRHILTPILGLHFPYYLNPNFSAKDGRIYWMLKMSLVGAAILFLLIDPLAALVLVWLPFLWVFTAINYWTDCIDHGGIVGNEDELDASRNLVVPKMLRAILFPRNDCFHLVHHLFPLIPANHLEACHNELLHNRSYNQRVTGGAKAAPIMTPAE